METKKCSNKKCPHGPKPQQVTNFHKRSGRGGYQDMCKDCYRERSRKHAEKRNDNYHAGFNMFIG